MQNLFKKQQGFTLIELMIVISIIGILATIVLPGYKDYLVASRWSKSIYGVRALKIAVENCLSDTGGTFSLCNDLSELKIGGYGVTQYASGNGEYLSIQLIASTAAIQIIGDKLLSYCILTINPSFTAQEGMITWSYTMTSGNASVADASKCRTFVKRSN